MVIGDRYALDALPLGQGGMGAVYAGHDRHLDRRVAVKLLRLPSGPDQELERRFIREARILARLEHPGAPVLYDFGTHEQRLYPGDAVHRGRHGGRRGERARPAAGALGGRHRRPGVRGAVGRARAVDLPPRPQADQPHALPRRQRQGAGLRPGHAARRRRRRPFTRIGQILGTPAYMAPEQIQHGVAEPRSDLYALGCVLHEMLTGRQLFTGPTDYVVFEKQVKQRPPAVPGVPARAGHAAGPVAGEEAGRPARRRRRALSSGWSRWRCRCRCCRASSRRRRVRAGCTPGWSAASSTARSPSRLKSLLTWERSPF